MRRHAISNPVDSGFSGVSNDNACGIQFPMTITARIPDAGGFTTLLFPRSFINLFCSRGTATNKKPKIWTFEVSLGF